MLPRNSEAPPQSCMPPPLKSSNCFSAPAPDPNLANGDGETALMHAVERGDRDAVTALLAHGADPTIRSHAGASAISIAQQRHRQGILALLQNRGASGQHAP